VKQTVAGLGSAGLHTHTQSCLECQENQSFTQLRCSRVTGDRLTLNICHSNLLIRKEEGKLREWKGEEINRIL
jgi:hypothetical protein